MNLTSTYSKSFTFYGLNENDEFNSITFNGTMHYATLKNKTGIYTFDKVFRFVDFIPTEESFDLIYYDKYNKRLFLTKVDTPNELYQYSPDFKLIQRYQLRSGKDYGPIRSIQVLSNSSRLYITTEQMIGFCYLNNLFIQEFKVYEARIHASFIHSFNDSAYVSVITQKDNQYINELLDHTGTILESKQLPIWANGPLLRIFEDSDVEPPHYKIIEPIATNLYQVSILETNLLVDIKEPDSTLAYKIVQFNDDSTVVEERVHAAEIHTTEIPKEITEEDEEEYLNGEDYIDVNSIHMESNNIDETSDLGYEGDRNIELESEIE